MNKDQKRKEKFKRDLDAIMAAMPDNREVKPSEVAQWLNVDRKTMYHRFYTLESEGKVVRSGSKPARYSKRGRKQEIHPTMAAIRLPFKMIGQCFNGGITA